MNEIKVLEEKKMINEIIILRAIACLSVVSYHSIKHVTSFTEGSRTIEYLLGSISGLLAFGTPTFVFIAILLMAISYPNKVPNDFYKKKVKYVLLPFIAMAIFYAVPHSIGDLKNLPKLFLLNMFGYFHGWFILLIFQFYFLYHFFNKYLKEKKPTTVLLVSFVINIIYLGFFNFTSPSNSNQFIEYIWERGFWLLFPGYLFYFSIAYYGGKNYTGFLKLIENRKRWIITLFIISLLLIIYNNSLGILEFGSKRIDMILFTATSIMLLLNILSGVKKTPYVIKLISNYSFGIYLMHMFYLMAFKQLLLLLNLDFGYWSILLWISGSVMTSIITMNILNRFKFGKFIIGQVGRNKKRTIEPKIISNETSARV